MKHTPDLSDRGDIVSLETFRALREANPKQSPACSLSPVPIDLTSVERLTIWAALGDAVAVAAERGERTDTLEALRGRFM